jgi:hypothetical protein
MRFDLSAQMGKRVSSVHGYMKIIENVAEYGTDFDPNLGHLMLCTLHSHHNLNTANPQSHNSFTPNIKADAYTLSSHRHALPPCSDVQQQGR